MPNALAYLWPHLDGKDPLFSERLIRSWPDNAFDRLVAVGLLHKAESATSVVCPSCPDGHEEEVVALEAPDGSCRFFIPCPANLRVQVSEESLRQWAINFDRLAAQLAAALGATGQVTAVVPGRLWRLGKIDWRSAKREALFARGLHMADGPRLRERIGRHGRVIVFVADQVPRTETWAKRPPAVVPLSQIATVCDSGIELDRVGLTSMVAEADAVASAAETEALDRRQLKLIVRQQVKAEQKSLLSDDVLVAAYRQHSSYRKAADALCTEGFQTDRYAVERAVKRAGGIQAVRRGTSSSSVVRTVASQPRDRKRKFASSIQPPEPE